MEVREQRADYLAERRFKLTEAGVVPEEWPVITIGSAAQTSSGTTPPRAQAERYFRGGDVAWVKTLDLNNSEITTTEEAVTSIALAETSLRLYPPGTVLVAMYGGYKQIGRTGLLQISATVNQALTAVRPNPRVVHAGYLLRVLNFRVAYWQSVASSSRKDPNITSKDVRDFPLARPRIAEQEAIAEALSDADALVESLGQLLSRKRQIKQGAMQELLTGRRRLPGFADAWVEQRLAVLLQVPVTDGPHLTPRFVEAGVPFLSVNNLIDGKISFEDLRFVSREDHESFSRKCRPRRGDLLMGKAASVGKVAIVDTDVEFNIWSPLALMRINDRNDGRFFYYQLQSSRLERQIALLTNASSQGNIGMGDIEQLSFFVPPKAEQSAIAAILADMDAELTALEARLAKTRLLKQGIAQALLTGRIRLV
jgi:type I restriction enzyme, S subunit